MVGKMKKISSLSVFYYFAVSRSVLKLVCSFKENEKTFIIKNKSPISFEFKSNCVHLSPALSILIEVH